MCRTAAARFLLGFLVAVSLAATVRGEEKGWSLREIPAVDPVADQASSEAEAKEIKALIRELAKVDAPDVGYSGTMAGDAFAPLPALDSWGGWTVVPHHHKRSDPLQQLVALGPRALPFLLEALTDKTPTKLTLRPPYDNSAGQLGPRERAIGMATCLLLQVPDGGMEPGREMPCNPMNRQEMLALKKAGIQRRVNIGIGSGTDAVDDLKADHIKSYRYTVTVGDLCFVALGQITNRLYLAARYQSTGCVFVNSPAHDAKMAGAVRAVWEKRSYRSHLFESLLIDFHTRGGDEDRDSERLQIGAAIRLLYYFPTEGGPIVAQRLRELDVASEGLTAVDSRVGYDINGIWADDLLKAVTYSEQKDVRRELLDVFRRTIHSQFALAVLPGIPKERDAEVLAKLKLFLKALPKSEDEGYGEGYQLLTGVGERFGDQAGEVFEQYLKNGSPQRRLTLCNALRQKWGQRWAVPLLTPLLTDKTQALKERYSVKRGSFEPRLPRRICDEAALAIAQHDDEISFRLEGPHEELDRQIDLIRKELADKEKRR